MVISDVATCPLTRHVQNVIEIHRPPLPVYQAVIEKTRGLALRTQAMGASMVRAPVALPPTGETPAVAVAEGAR